MPEVNIDEQDGKFRLTRTTHAFKNGDFRLVQEPVKDKAGKVMDGGGFETDSEAGYAQIKAMRQLNGEQQEGKPSGGQAHGSFY